jgi:hypothetical protein
MTATVFRGVMPCSLVDVSEVRTASIFTARGNKNNQSAGSKQQLSDDCLFSLLFHPEDGGSMFLSNVE